jgi:hypothetical protein
MRAGDVDATRQDDFRNSAIEILDRNRHGETPENCGRKSTELTKMMPFAPPARKPGGRNETGDAGGLT